MALEAFGPAANIVGLIQFTGKLTAMGYDYIGGVARASKDCNDLVYELSSLARTLTNLQSHIEKPGTQHSPAIRQLNEPGGPIEGCTKHLTELQSKLGNRDGLKGLIDSLTWPFKEAETMQHISRIERYKSAFYFAMSVDQLALTKSLKADVRSMDIVVQRTDNVVRDSRRVAYETKHVADVIDITTQNIYTVVHDTNVTLRNLKDRIKSNSEIQEENRLMEKREKVLEWLYPGPFDTRHTEVSNKRRENTGDWVLQLPGFQKWMKQESNKLCGYGIPGAGKTFISSLVIDHLEALSQKEDYCVAYIYFDYNAQSQQSPTNVFASLLRQFARRLQYLPSSIESLYDKLQPNKKRPALKELYANLSALRKSFSRTFLVFDALDECHEEYQRRELLPLFERLGMEDGISLFFHQPAISGRHSRQPF